MELDLKAVDAAARDLWDRMGMGGSVGLRAVDWDDLQDDERQFWRGYVSLTVAAAAPHIAAQVAERIAQAIEAERETGWVVSGRVSVSRAARIAREAITR